MLHVGIVGKADCLEIAMMKIMLIFHKGDSLDTPLFRFGVTSNHLLVSKRKSAQTNFAGKGLIQGSENLLQSLDVLLTWDPPKQVGFGRLLIFFPVNFVEDIHIYIYTYNIFATKRMYQKHPEARTIHGELSQDHQVQTNMELGICWDSAGRLVEPQETCQGRGNCWVFVGHLLEETGIIKR